MLPTHREENKNLLPRADHPFAIPYYATAFQNLFFLGPKLEWVDHANVYTSPPCEIY